MSDSKARINGIPVMEWLKGSIDLAFMGNGVSIGGEELEELLDIVERKSAVTSPWIPVSERLPKHMEPVFFNDGIGHYDEDAEAWYSRMECSWPYKRCTYTPEKWMPLPQ